MQKRGDEVDPRVQVELERLNEATDDINRLEVDLDEARAAFRQMVWDASAKIESLAMKVSPSLIERAKPYYQARIDMRQAAFERDRAAYRCDKANSSHAAAKEMVRLAEEGLTMEGRTFDHAWQEMLNHATIRVNEAETERTQSEAQYKRAVACFTNAEMRALQLQKDLKRPISKTRSYYEAKAQFNKLLEAQSLKVRELEGKVQRTKASYSDALRNLETISDEIHKLRKADSGRSNGVSTLSLDGTSSSSESTGSADSYPAEEYLRLPDRIGLSDSSPMSPQSNYVKLEEPSEDASPLEDGHVERSEFLPDHVDNPYYAPEPPSSHPPASFPGEDDGWCDIPLVPMSGSAPVAAPSPSIRTEKPLNRRQSIDTLISGSTGKVKEILSQSILKLNIGSLSERRGSLESCGRGLLGRSSFISSEPESLSDVEPIPNMEMLTDDQISSLMLDEELERTSKDILAAVFSKTK